MNDAPSRELLEDCRRGDAAAERELFDRYAARLVGLARARLSRRLAARVDPEDVAQSALRSFFLRARDGDVVLRESGDLWRLLARITVRKVCRAARRHTAGCRSVAREGELGEALARGPSPADAAALLDEVAGALAPLGPVGRRIAEMRLAGHDVDEIAAEVGRSARTVRRALAALGEELERRLITGDSQVSPDVPAGLGVTLSFGDIVLERQLGAGGMGKVYRARLRESGEPVAVKLLRRPLRRHEPAAARFLQEALLLSRLRHPGIVAFRALGQLPGGGHFLVTDLIEGTDLARRLSAGPVSVGEAARWVSEAADAIQHAHEQGVVHCDLKPSNLLLDAAGRVRVTDFGLARSLADGGGAVGGTAGFLAPEQSDPSLGPVTPRTDVYGLGAVLRALLPTGLDELCRRCLAARPEDRPPSASAVALALESWRQPL